MWVATWDKGIAQPLIMNGVYEPTVTALLESILKPGMQFVDIGANIGYYTLIAAQRVNKVIAFEPDTLNFNLLWKNVEQNGYKNVEMFQKALGKGNGQVSVFRDSENSGATSLSEKNIQHHADYFRVEMVSLDECLDGPVDVMKIDAQGYEGQIIEGAIKTIRRCKPIIIMEYWPYGLRNCGTDPEELYKRLVGLGYNPTVIGENIDADLSSLLSFCASTHSIALPDETNKLNIAKGTGTVNILWQRNLTLERR